MLGSESVCPHVTQLPNEVLGWQAVEEPHPTTGDTALMVSLKSKSKLEVLKAVLEAWPEVDSPHPGTPSPLA